MALAAQSHGAAGGSTRQLSAMAAESGRHVREEDVNGPSGRFTLAFGRRLEAENRVFDEHPASLDKFAPGGAAGNERGHSAADTRLQTQGRGPEFHAAEERSRALAVLSSARSRQPTSPMTPRLAAGGDGVPSTAAVSRARQLLRDRHPEVIPAVVGLDVPRTAATLSSLELKRNKFARGDGVFELSAERDVKAAVTASAQFSPRRGADNGENIGRGIGDESRNLHAATSGSRRAAVHTPAKPDPGTSEKGSSANAITGIIGRLGGAKTSGTDESPMLTALQHRAVADDLQQAVAELEGEKARLVRAMEEANKECQRLRVEAESRRRLRTMQETMGVSAPPLMRGLFEARERVRSQLLEVEELDREVRKAASFLAEPRNRWLQEMFMRWRHWAISARSRVVDTQGNTKATGGAELLQAAGSTTADIIPPSVLLVNAAESPVLADEFNHTPPKILVSFAQTSDAPQNDVAAAAESANAVADAGVGLLRAIGILEEASGSLAAGPVGTVSPTPAGPKKSFALLADVTEIPPGHTHLSPAMKAAVATARGSSVEPGAFSPAASRSRLLARKNKHKAESDAASHADVPSPRNIGDGGFVEAIGGDGDGVDDGFDSDDGKAVPLADAAADANRGDAVKAAASRKVDREEESGGPIAWLAGAFGAVAARDVFTVGQRVDCFSVSSNMWVSARVKDVKDGDVSVRANTADGSELNFKFPVNDRRVRPRYREGDYVQCYSSSLGRWMSAKIEEMKPELVTVAYEGADGSEFMKDLAVDNANFRGNCRPGYDEHRIGDEVEIYSMSQARWVSGRVRDHQPPVAIVRYASPEGDDITKELSVDMHEYLRPNYRPGDLVRVYNGAEQQWLFGEVSNLPKRLLTVTYSSPNGGGTTTKKVPVGSDLLRVQEWAPIDLDSGESDVCNIWSDGEGGELDEFKDRHDVLEQANRLEKQRQDVGLRYHQRIVETTRTGVASERLKQKQQRKRDPAMGPKSALAAAPLIVLAPPLPLPPPQPPPAGQGIEPGTIEVASSSEKAKQVGTSAGLTWDPEAKEFGKSDGQSVVVEQAKDESNTSVGPSPVEADGKSPRVAKMPRPSTAVLAFPKDSEDGRSSFATRARLSARRVQKDQLHQAAQGSAKPVAPVVAPADSPSEISKVVEQRPAAAEAAAAIGSEASVAQPPLEGAAESETVPFRVDTAAAVAGTSLEQSKVVAPSTVKAMTTAAAVPSTAGTNASRLAARRQKKTALG
eukprot:TRINITY_DN33909_c0_g1_i1.p1 TRINITY_DN33909_c0_g1~~TRINITY_DN33909_c0_g1_i1.p1  ORF type:complete len:1237 (-),score=247.77 TRINITY_DN33909_c0_g1_i1:89-3799(-)